MTVIPAADTVDFSRLRATAGGELVVGRALAVTRGLSVEGAAAVVSDRAGAAVVSGGGGAVVGDGLLPDGTSCGVRDDHVNNATRTITKVMTRTASAANGNEPEGASGTRWATGPRSEV